MPHLRVPDLRYLLSAHEAGHIALAEKHGMVTDYAFIDPSTGLGFTKLSKVIEGLKYAHLCIAGFCGEIFFCQRDFPEFCHCAEAQKAALERSRIDFDHLFTVTRIKTDESFDVIDERNEIVNRLVAQVLNEIFPSIERNLFDIQAELFEHMMVGRRVLDAIRSATAVDPSDRQRDWEAIRLAREVKPL